MKRAFATAAVAAALTGLGWFELHGHAPTERFLTGRVTIGDVARIVSATGSLQPPEVFKVMHQEVPPELAAATREKTRAFEGSTGYLWVLKGAELHPVKVTLGLSDGAFTEVSGPGITDGMAAVTGEVLVR